MDSILKRNAFDKIADTVTTLNKSLIQLSKADTLLTDEEIEGKYDTINALTIAEKLGDQKALGILR